MARDDRYYWYFEDIDGRSLERRLADSRGVALMRLGSLSRYAGIQKWSPSPVGYGQCPDQLRLWLSIHGLCLFSHHGNEAVEDDGRVMTTRVLRYLHASDEVVVVDRRGEEGRALLGRSTVIPALTEDESARQPPHKVDGVRWSNHVDVRTVVKMFLDRKDRSLIGLGSAA